MEKLELKHLAPYLPYKVQYYAPHLIWIGNPPEPSHDEWGEDEVTLENAQKVIHSGLSLILRPMSDLGRQFPQTVVGRRYVDEINKNCMYSIDKYGDFYDLPEATSIDDVYESFEGLFKYHFDVFNLIERGLAVDINTLTK